MKSFTLTELKELAKEFKEKVDKEYYAVHKIDEWPPEYDVDNFLDFLEQRSKGEQEDDIENHIVNILPIETKQYKLVPARRRKMRV